MTESNSPSLPLQSFGGVVPSLAVTGGLGPPRSEIAPGAMMPWADRLWIVTYVSHRSRSGTGGGLYEIDENLRMTHRPESYTGTYANRYVHWESNQLVIGPYVISANREVRRVESLLETRICSTMTHLTDPDNMVYMLGMEGEFYEMNVYTLETNLLFDLNKELGGLPGEGYTHFKAAYTAYGRVFVANNSYDERDFLGQERTGRLAEWDGETWTVLEEKPFVEVMGHGNFMNAVFATGWDRASAILRVYTRDDETWRRYRLPKASHTFDHMWQTEWPRIRQTEHERFLMDHHGMFYELSPWAYGNKVWGIRPISTHLWVMADFCSYRGMLVLGPDNASPASGSNHLTGEPQSGIWLGKTDDLWQFGKPSGWGGPWWEDAVRSGEPSDPYLMTGFDKKVLHLTQESNETVRFRVEVDFLGTQKWQTYAEFDVPADGYVHHEFPTGFSAHWVRVTANRDCRATAYFMYT